MEAVPVRLSSCGKIRISFLCGMRMLLLSSATSTRKPRLYKIMNSGITPDSLMSYVQAAYSLVVYEYTFLRPPHWSIKIHMSFSTEYGLGDDDIIRCVVSTQGHTTYEHSMVLHCVPNLPERIGRTLEHTHLYDLLTLRTEFFFIDKTNYSAGIMKRWWIRTRSAWRRKMILGLSSAEAIAVYGKRNKFALNDDCLKLIFDWAIPPRLQLR